MTDFFSLNTHSSRTRQYQASSTIHTNLWPVGNAKSNPQNTYYHPSQFFCLWYYATTVTTFYHVFYKNILGWRRDRCI